jgi:N-acetylglucosamine kinase-like BadF-type ATPase
VIRETKTQNSKSRIFLGVDGGQSHTEAVIADENGNILANGFGGASNHAEHPGGRERLRSAILSSVGKALENANLPPIEEMVFSAGHFGMTGGAEFKEEIISKIVAAEHLTISHDAPTALFGATAGEAGIVVIAGTGSVIYGENKLGEITKIGGLGYLFSDEGSGFWLALQTIRLAIKEQDGLLEPAGLEQLVLDFFRRGKIREITNDFYNAKITRDDLASFAKAAHKAAVGGNIVIQNQIKFGANVLVESVQSVINRLGFQDNIPVGGVGGMFQGELMRKYFSELLQQKIPQAKFIKPRFNPAIGALLLAYREARIEINEDLLTTLEKGSKKNE